MKCRRNVFLILLAVVLIVAPLAGCAKSDGARAGGGGASISGKVTGEQGKGVAGVVVWATDEHFVTTDNAGNYIIKGLEKGAYYLNFTSNSDKYFNGYYSDIDFDGYVAVKEGEAVKNIDFELEAGKPASVSGKVTDGKGKPVADVIVTPCGVTSAGWAKTDKNGQYILKGLTPSTSAAVEVDGSKQGYSIKTVPSENYYDEGAKALSFGLGERLNNIDISLTKGAQVSGVLKDTEGKPVKDTWVGASSADYSSGGKTDSKGKFEIPAVPNGPCTVQVSDIEKGLIAKKDLTIQGHRDVSGVTLNYKTDPNNIFTSSEVVLKGLITAKKDALTKGVWVRAESEDYSENGDVNTAGEYRFKSLAPGEYMITAGTFDSSDFAFANVTIAAGGVAQTVDLTLEPGAEIYGTVKDTAGTPLFGVNVSVGTLISTADSNYHVNTAQCNTLRDGRFRIRDVVPGDLEIWADTSSDPWRSNVIIPAPTPITVSAGQKIANYDIKLEQGGILRGKVTDAEGKSIAGLMIIANEAIDYDSFATDEEANQVVQNAGSGIATTDKNGAYEIKGLKPGQYAVGFNNSEDSDVGYIDLPEPKIVEVAAGGAGAVLDLSLMKGGTFAGKLTGPFPTQDNYSVDLELGNMSWSKPVDEETGAFKYTGLADGTYKIRIPKWVATGDGQYESSGNQDQDGGTVTISGANIIKDYTIAIK